MARGEEFLLHLTDKQKLVFYGLVRWPELNDAALAKKINVNRRTITFIRKMLHVNGMYDSIYIPNFNVLGLELLTVTYGNFKFFSDDITKRKSLKINPMDYPELIYCCITNTDFLMMFLSERFTNFKLSKDGITNIFNKYSNLEKISSAHFPLELCKIIFLFDFAPSLQEIFRLRINEEKNMDDEDFKSQKLTRPKKLTEKEKLVMYALMQLPEATDSKIAQLTKISRPTVNSIKDRLRKEGIISELRIPNIEKSDYGLLVLNHSRLNLDFMKEVYYSERIMQKHELPTQPFFLVSNTTEPESVLFLIFHDFTEYKKCQDKIGEFAKKHKLTTGPVEELLYPVEKLNILKKLNFAPIVKKVLKLDVSF